MDTELQQRFNDALALIQTLKNLVFKDKPKAGLDPTFYHTGTYEGDIFLYETINSFIEQNNG